MTAPADVQPPAVEAASGWREGRDAPSLSEVFRSVAGGRGGSWFRRLLAFLGPG